MRSSALVLLVALLAWGCEGDTASLVVGLRTDFVAGVEFTEVVTRVGGVERIYPARPGTDFVRGVRVAEFEGLDYAPNTRVDVVLRGPGGDVVSRPVLVDLRRPAVAVSVVVTRSCRDVTCAADQACFGGTCVDERCAEETPEYCGDEPQCESAEECGSMDACARPRCTLGACLYEPIAGSCGPGSVCVPDRGCVEAALEADAGAGGGMDAGGAGVRDAGPPEVDAGSLCMGVVCGEFEYCVAGVCTEFTPCRGDGTCAAPGEVCHSRRCIPGDLDADGDGVPAAMDCDEANPDRFPGNTESCNAADDDCDMMMDEGDPATLCEGTPGGGICMMGSCGCPEGTFDLDRSVSGCECVASPPLTEGRDCASAIDLGSLADSGEMMVVTGNVMPDDREVWYRFRAVDASDTACDNFHVRAQLSSNPLEMFEITVFRGDCATVGCVDAGYTDYDWATDFRADVMGTLSGQCPCYAPGGRPMADVSACEDDSADFFVRVRRRAGSPLACDDYSLELSNGVYDSP